MRVELLLLPAAGSDVATRGGLRLNATGGGAFNARDRSVFQSLVWAMPRDLLAEVETSAFQGAFSRNAFFGHTNVKHACLLPLVASHSLLEPPGLAELRP